MVDTDRLIFDLRKLESVPKVIDYGSWMLSSGVGVSIYVEVGLQYLHENFSSFLEIPA